MRKYDVVFFDAANTLLYPYPSVGEVYAQVASRYGVETTGEAVQRAFRQAWGTVETLARNDPVRYGVGEPDGRRFWHTLVHATFSKLAVPERFDDFFEELYQLFKQPTVWRLFPECLEVLQTLRQQGYMVGVISNWDIRLLELLQSMGLMTYVQHVSISALVGWKSRTVPSSSTRSRRSLCRQHAPCTSAITCRLMPWEPSRPACNPCGCSVRAPPMPTIR